jgi:hypothetical protein
MNTLKKVEVSIKSNNEKLSPLPVTIIPKKEGEKLLPLEDRLHRLNQLFTLQVQYNKLQESLQKLNDFEIKKDGERSRLAIQDDSRNEFSTYHPEIVQDVVNFLAIRIKEKIKNLEPQLKW